MLFDKRIKEIRNDRRYTQEEFGKIIGVSKASVCGYEKGTRTPSINKLIEIADILSVDFTYLIGIDKFVVADDSVNYGLNIGSSEIDFIKKLRNYPEKYDLLLNDFIRCLKKI